MKTKRPSRLKPVKLKPGTRRAAHRTVRRQLPPHRRLLVHPVTIFTLLCVGVLIVGLTYRSVADSYLVSAKVAAASLTQGAIITNPLNGQVFATSPIIVQGSCPTNSYIILYRNSAFSGSAWCNANTFTIETSLSLGTDTLVAQDFNITDDPGPASPAISVTYAPPASKINPASGNPVTYPALNRSVAPLLLNAQYRFQAFLVGSNFTWDVELLGGVPDYSINIDWGDAHSSQLQLSSDQTLTISHRYQVAGYFPIKLQAADAKGGSAFLQIAALIKQPGVVGFSSAQPSTTSHCVSTGSASAVSGGCPAQPYFWQRVNSWLWLIWPIYLVVALMALSFWLGERQEYQNLLQRRYRTGKRRPRATL